MNICKNPISTKIGDLLQKCLSSSSEILRSTFSMIKKIHPRWWFWIFASGPHFLPKFSTTKDLCGKFIYIYMRTVFNYSKNEKSERTLVIHRPSIHPSTISQIQHCLGFEKGSSKREFWKCRISFLSNNENISKHKWTHLGTAKQLLSKEKISTVQRSVI